MTADAGVPAGPPADAGRRQARIERTGPGRYRAVNDRGGSIEFGTGDTADFTPVELLLVAMAGCSGIDVDLITGKRAEPERLEVTASGTKVRDADGNHLTDLDLTYDVRFPAGPDGDAARAVLPRSIAQSHDRLCSVSRTVELASPVTTHQLPPG